MTDLQASRASLSPRPTATWRHRVGLLLALVAACVAVAEVVWFFGFTRYYFREASGWPAAGQVLGSLAVAAYGAALWRTGRWQPWQRGYMGLNRD